MATEVPQRPPVQFLLLLSEVRSLAGVAVYAAETLRAHWHAIGLPAADVPDITGMVVDDLPMAQAAEHPHMGPTTEREMQVGMRCARRQIDAMVPLLAGEQVDSDFFTYLREPWEDCPAGTVVLQRRTNFATQLFVLTNVRIDPRSVMLHVSAPQSRAGQSDGGQVVESRVSLGGPPVTQSIAADLAKKLAEQLAKNAFKGVVSQLAGGVIAGGLAGAIINGVFDLLFPDKGESVFDTYFRGLQEIVRQELSASVISQIAGTITSLKDELENRYGPRRLTSDLSKPADRKDLFKQLSSYESAFYLGSGGMLGTLQQEDYQLAGFPVFLLGAGLHLMILQEMANIDPGNKAPDFNPLKSSYGLPQVGTVARFAKKYADFADLVWPKIQEKRRSHVTYHTEAVPVFRHFEHYGFYVDDLIDDSKRGRTKFVQENDKNGNAHYTAGHSPEDVKKAMNDYIAARVMELDKSLPEHQAVVASWRGLIDRPLNLDIKG